MISSTLNVKLMTRWIDNLIILLLISYRLFLQNRYNREEVVRSLGKEINLNPPLTLGQLPDTPEELLKLDQVKWCWFLFIVSFYTIVMLMFMCVCVCVEFKRKKNITSNLGFHQIRAQSWYHLCERKSIQWRTNSR